MSISSSMTRMIGTAPPRSRCDALAGVLEWPAQMLLIVTETDLATRTRSALEFICQTIALGAAGHDRRASDPQEGPRQRGTDAADELRELHTGAPRSSTCRAPGFTVLRARLQEWCMRPHGEREGLLIPVTGAP